MLRIINKQEPTKPDSTEGATQPLTEKSKALLKIIGIAIADNPKAIKALLDDYSVELPETADEKLLASELLSAICENDQAFNNDLAAIILDCGVGDAYDSVDIKSLQNKNGEAGYDEEGGGGGGGLIGGITNAIGGIAKSIGAGREAKEQATSKTLQGIYSYRAQVAKADQSKSNTKLYMMLGLFVFLGFALYAFFQYQNKQSQVQPLIA